MSKLDSLLEQIAPSRTIERLHARADRALNSFPAPRATIERWDDYTDFMGRFLRHVEGTILEVRDVPDVPMQYYWQRCVILLLQIHGPSGEKASFEFARTGVEGGLRGVMRAVAERCARNYISNEIAARVLAYWNGLSVDGQLAAAAEYVSKFGHLLSSELLEASAVRIKANMPRVLQEHPRLMHRLRHAGR